MNDATWTAREPGGDVPRTPEVTDLAGDTRPVVIFGMPFLRWAGLCCWGLIGGLWLSATPESGLRAGEIVVPNASFESPSTNFVSTLIDDWQKPPKPDWYDEGGGFLWDQLTGIFRNPAPTNPSHIDNCDGAQALWLFAVPEVGLYQELGDAAMPSGDDVVFEVGKSYQLTVGVIGGGGGMLEGATLKLGFYYRDEASNRVSVAETSITNSVNVFSNLTHLIDFEARVPAVSADDAWSGRPIGLGFLSTVGFDLQGGYWDLDNVRLTSAGPPALVDVGVADGQIRFTLESEAGLQFELLTSPDPRVPLDGWTRLATLTNDTGRLLYSEPATNSGGWLYRARQLE
jgi:hypothetical protein